MTPLKLFLGLLGACLLVQGCTHSIRRAALVPHQQPVAHSGAAAQFNEFSIGSPNVVSAGKPRLAADENAGIAIPRWQGQSALRLPWGRNLTLGAHFDYGFDEGSIALSDDQSRGATYLSSVSHGDAF